MNKETFYLGVKIISAVCMTRLAYNNYRGWEVPADENQDDEGYLVEYEETNPPTPNTPDRKGYVSWSPKDVFEEAYRETSGMTFGFAIEALKKGEKLARKGWNGRGIFIELQVPDENSKMTHPYIFIDTSGLQTDNKDAPKNLVPWLASQTDMLAEDWCIV